MSFTIQEYLQNIALPDPHSHKGENGKVLVIGGSELFHAASRWCLDTVSFLVDMVFYSSVPSNNELIQQAKGEFWNGIVIPRDQVEQYVTEADVIVIGPGMERADTVRFADTPDEYLREPHAEEWQTDTFRITNYLLKKYPQKKWVLDAGALQMVDPRVLGEGMILTPHAGEFERLEGLLKSSLRDDSIKSVDWLTGRGVTILLKGPVDYVYSGSDAVEVAGGNAGMTKGGTGDVLAGLVAGLYVAHDAITAAVVASFVNKTAAEDLWQSVGPFFTATDLLNQVPKTLWRLVQPR